eukprot:3048959-Rhodomonas_salina.2
MCIRDRCQELPSHGRRSRRGARVTSAERESDDVTLVRVQAAVVDDPQQNDPDQVAQASHHKHALRKLLRREGAEQEGLRRDEEEVEGCQAARRGRRGSRSVADAAP